MMKAVLLAICITLAGCTNEVPGYIVTGAVSACKDNGGVHTLVPINMYGAWALCVDGTRKAAKPKE